MEGVDGDPERAEVLYGAGDAHFVMEKAPIESCQLQPGIGAPLQPSATETATAFTPTAQP